MLTLKQITTSITDILKSKFPNIDVTSNDVKEGFQRPSFFVDLENVNRNAALYMVERSMTVRIYYFPSDRYINSTELLQTQDDLAQLFDLTIKMGNRTITIDETTMEVVDGVLQLNFDIRFFDARDNSSPDQNNKIMQELNIRKVDE